LLDLGLPLDAELAAPPPLPPVPGLCEWNPSLVGVLVSHGHPDHWGLATCLPGHPRIYIGKTTARILREAKFFTPMGAGFHAAGFLRDREPFRLGPFRITPYLLDHSAFDAYALLVDAGGRRLLYSGDLRAHGRRAALTERLITDPPPNIDVLLLEGTHVRAERVPAPSSNTEADVETTAADICRGTGTGMVLAAYSAQNVDRMATLYRAARATGRTFVLDLYAASLATAVEDADLPIPGAEDVLIYVPQAQRMKVKHAAEFHRVNALNHARIYPEQLAKRAGELVLTFRASMCRELVRAGCLTNAALLWSMWSGYLYDTRRGDLRRWATERDITLTVAHASGHATVGDLQRVARAVRARQVVPIHTAAPGRFDDLFERVRAHPDGEWWEA